MAEARITRVLINPGKRKLRVGGRKVAARKKRLTLKQKLFFGTPQQRAAAKLALRGGRKRKRVANRGLKRRVVRKRSAAKRLPRVNRKRHGKYVFANSGRRRKRRVSRVHNVTHRRRKRRVANVGQIVTYTLGNPGRKKRSKSVARRRKASTTRRRRTRRVSHRRRNPSLRSLLGMGGRKRRYTRRRRGNTGMRRRRHYRRNSGISLAGGSNILAIIGGATLTSMITSRLVPAQYQAGFMGVLSTAVVAMAQSYLIGKVKPGLAQPFQTGGLVAAAIKLLQQVGLGGYVQGLSGVYARSNFWQPQVSTPNSITNFYRPAMLPSPMPATAMRGRTGRLA